MGNHRWMCLMNYQRNAIFAIALLGLLVLSACATTDENLAGDAAALEAALPVVSGSAFVLPGGQKIVGDGAKGWIFQQSTGTESLRITKDGTIPTIGSTIDAESCEFQIAYAKPKENPYSTGVDCSWNQVVSSVTHIGCNSREKAIITGTSWAQGRTPQSILYTCEEDVDGAAAWRAPDYVFGYCCTVKNSVNTANAQQTLQHATVDREGKLTTS